MLFLLTCSKYLNLHRVAQRVTLSWINRLLFLAIPLIQKCAQKRPYESIEDIWDECFLRKYSPVKSLARISFLSCYKETASAKRSDCLINESKITLPERICSIMHLSREVDLLDWHLYRHNESENLWGKSTLSVKQCRFQRLTICLTDLLRT